MKREFFSLVMFVIGGAAERLNLPLPCSDPQYHGLYFEDSYQTLNKIRLLKT